jgi:3-hydroxybutyryl-CoA dehydratase
MSGACPAFAALAPAQQASVTRAFTHEDLAAWQALARSSAEEGEVVPEPLVAGLFSYLLGERLPGHGTNYLKQHLAFEGRARAGEALTAQVRIIRLRPDKKLVNLQTVCTGENGRTICRGEALVLFRH